MSQTTSFHPLHTPSLRLQPRVRAVALGACLITVILALRLWSRSIADFAFEDAYMFFRYAVQMHHGFGISWNPGGPHTFGLTSLSWLLVVWLGSFASSIPPHLLPTLSILTGMLALVLLTWLFSRRARSPWLRHVEITFPLVSIPLLFSHQFDVSLTNGMETMLGLLLITLFLFQILRLIDRPSPRRALLLALLAVLIVLTRPEALLPIALTPLCALPLLPRDRRLSLLALFFVTIGLLLAADLLANRAYFGTPVPLAFYIKAVHGYEGYRFLLNPFAANLSFFAIASPALLAITLFSRRHQLPFLCLFFLPLAAVCLYLLSVLQIMGAGARYYVPFLPFLLLPALLLTDEALAPASLASGRPPAPSPSLPSPSLPSPSLASPPSSSFFSSATPNTPITSSVRSEPCSRGIIPSGIRPSSPSTPRSLSRLPLIPGAATAPLPASPHISRPAHASLSPRSASSVPPRQTSICSTWPVSTTAISPTTTSI